jgi:hypothetical protein
MALTRVRQQQINTTVTGFDDPLVPINAAQTGVNTGDIGFIFNRGTLENAALIWDETNDTFKVVLTTDDGANNLVTGNVIAANFSAGNITASTITATVTGNASTATKLATARTINGVAFDGTANITITAAAAASTLSGNTIASNVLYSSLTSVGTLGNLTVANLSTLNNVIINGNLTINGSSTVVNSAMLNVVDKNITVANGATNSASADGAGLTVAGANATLLYASSTDSWGFNKTLYATSFSGAGTGLTGTAASLTAGTATVANALAVPRYINGVAFDGTASITVTANAATLSGSALNSTVTDSSLTSVGTLGNLNVTGTATAGTFSGVGTSITGTATTLNIGGNAGTATKLATGRYINDSLFDGSTNITITAAANTLTGTTLNSGVITSSLTSVGTLNNLTVGSAATYSAVGLLGTFVSNIAGYNQLILQNKSANVNASSSFVVSNDIATDTSYYGELGINSSTHSGASSFNLTSAVYVASATSDLTIGTYGANNIHFVNNTSSVDTATFFANGVAKFNQPIIGSLVGGTDHADKLTTARNINSVPFDGTADITITANASTLSGTFLNSNVTASSLTTVGNLTALNVTGNITTQAITGLVNTSLTSSSAVPLSYLQANYTSMSRVVKLVAAGYTAAMTATGTIPFDNTIPLSTEGTQIWTTTFTPASTASRFIIDQSFVVDAATSNRNMTIALFRNGTCINATVTNVISSGHPEAIAIHAFDSPATASAVTYMLRVGISTSGTWYLNQSIIAVFSTAATSDYTILEVL